MYGQWLLKTDIQNYQVFWWMQMQAYIDSRTKENGKRTEGNRGEQKKTNPTSD